MKNTLFAWISTMICVSGCSRHQKQEEVVCALQVPDSVLYMEVEKLVKPIRTKGRALNTMRKLGDALNPKVDSFLPTYKDSGWWRCFMCDRVYSIPPFPRYREFFVSYYYTFTLSDGKKYALEIKGKGKKDNRNKIEVEDVPLTDMQIFVKDLKTGRIVVFVFI
ncbi:hypothetical protein ICN84_04270 [Akkermansia glycaniphila]|uniref:hypothetical protein n=1 Tax=Akkermansia glycaniphila TaxID=1679444 RepID=UPI001C00FE68|nr:hypothetical protein [Akkermansia glycaniphila]MBT9449289.1 hypothetical protein [Akkermansia glycaniphila]